MSLGFDLKYAWHLSIKSWGYSLMCACVVALSLGLAHFMSKATYGRMWKPLGFPGSEHWYSVQIAPDAVGTAQPTVDAYTYQELVKHNRTADYLGAFANRAVVLSEGQASTRLRAAAISPRLLAGTRVPPCLGRIFEESDTQTGAAPVAILSFDTWQNYFAGDPSIIGKTARIDSALVQVIGVMPNDFFAFWDFELWLPLQMPNLARPSDSTMMLSPLIVSDNDSGLNSVLNEMKTAVDGVNGDYPDLFNSARHVALVPAHRMWTHGETPVFAMMGFMSAAVLLLGCVNVGLVFLSRLLERSRELALRTAIGASHWRLMRQCLLETAPFVVLGLIGGFGLLIIGMHWALGLAGFYARVLATGRLPNEAMVLGPIDFVGAVILAVSIWLLSTLIPAWRIANQDAALVLAGTGKGASLRGSNKSASLFVGLQVVISCVVLMVCGNMVLAVNKELGKPTGLNSSHVTLSTYPTVFDARYADTNQRLRYWENLTAAIESKMPGAEVAYTTTSPTRPAKVVASIETLQGTEHQGTLKLPFTTVSENYFKLLGLGLRSGRLFDSTDNSGSLKVAIVDEQLAARYWPNQDVLGKRVQLSAPENGSWLTIIGVVSAVRGQPYGTDLGVIYRPLRQAVPSEFQLLVKLPTEATDSRAALRAAAFSVDRDLPLQNLQTLDEYIAAMNLSYAAIRPTFIAIAIMTAILAASGLFGLISRSVTQRTQEVGIRRALGAVSWRATSMFLRQGAMYLCLAIVGIGVGTILANVISVTVPNVLDHVLLVTASVVLLMAGVIFAATYLPSRRAVALEPGDALRYE